MMSEPAERKVTALPPKEVKEILIAARNAALDYNAAAEKVQTLHSRLSSGKRINYANKGAVHERDGNPIERAYCRLADDDTHMRELYKTALSERDKAYALIRRARKKLHIAVLIKHYIQCKSWSQTAKELKCTKRHVIRLHGYALSEISKAFLNEKT